MCFPLQPSDLRPLVLSLSSPRAHEFPFPQGHEATFLPCSNSVSTGGGGRPAQVVHSVRLPREQKGIRLWEEKIQHRQRKMDL